MRFALVIYTMILLQIFQQCWYCLALLGPERQLVDLPGHGDVARVDSPAQEALLLPLGQGYEVAQNQQLLDKLHQHSVTIFASVVILLALNLAQLIARYTIRSGSAREPVLKPSSAGDQPGASDPGTGAARLIRQRSRRNPHGTPHKEASTALTGSGSSVTPRGLIPTVPVGAEIPPLHGAAAVGPGPSPACLNSPCQLSTELRTPAPATPQTPITPGETSACGAPGACSATAAAFTGGASVAHAPGVDAAAHPAQAAGFGQPAVRYAAGSICHEAPAQLSGPATITCSTAAASSCPGACSAPVAAPGSSTPAHPSPRRPHQAHQGTSRCCYVLPVAIARDLPEPRPASASTPDHKISLRVFLDLEGHVDPSSMHVEVLAAQHGAVLSRATLKQADIQAGCSVLDVPAARLDPDQALLHVLLFKCPGASGPGTHQPGGELELRGSEDSAWGCNYGCSSAAVAPLIRSSHGLHAHPASRRPKTRPTCSTGARASLEQSVTPPELPPPEPVTLLVALPVLCLPGDAAAEVQSQFGAMVRAYLDPGTSPGCPDPSGIASRLAAADQAMAGAGAFHTPAGESYISLCKRPNRLSWEEEPQPSKSFTTRPALHTFLPDPSRFLHMYPELGAELLRGGPPPPPQRRPWGREMDGFWHQGADAAQHQREPSLGAELEARWHARHDSVSSQFSPALAVAPGVFDRLRMMDEVLPSSPLHVLSVFSPTPEPTDWLAPETPAAVSGPAAAAAAAAAPSNQFSATHCRVFHEYAAKLALHLEVIRVAAPGRFSSEALAALTPAAPSLAAPGDGQGQGTTTASSRQQGEGEGEGGEESGAVAQCGDQVNHQGSSGGAPAAGKLRHLDLDAMTAQVCGIARPEDLPSISSGPLPTAPSPLYQNPGDPGTELDLFGQEAAGQGAGAAIAGPAPEGPGTGSEAGTFSGAGGEQQGQEYGVQSLDALAAAWLSSQQLSVSRRAPQAAAELAPGLLWYLLHQRLMHCFGLAVEWLHASQAVALLHGAAPVSPEVALAYVGEQLALSARPLLVVEGASGELGVGMEEAVSAAREAWQAPGGEQHEATLTWVENVAASAPTERLAAGSEKAIQRDPQGGGAPAGRTILSDVWVLSCQWLFCLVITLASYSLAACARGGQGYAAASVGLPQATKPFATRSVVRSTLLLGLGLRETPALLLLLLLLLWRPSTYSALRMVLFLGVDVLQLTSLLSYAVFEMYTTGLSRDSLVLVLLLVLYLQSLAVPFVLKVSTRVCIGLLFIEAVPAVVLLILTLLATEA